VINRKVYRLPENQYVPEKQTKTGIVLHHTVSRTAKSAYDWWLATDERVATAYLVEKDGTIYELFPADEWAWHLGKGVGTDNEKRTVGIEIVSEGGLQKVGDKYKSFYNPETGAGINHPEEWVVDLGKTWRGYRYFDVYTKKQIQSVVNLVYMLSDTYKIPRKMHKDLWTYDESIKSFEGIFTHAQVRPDKTDVHPKFPLEDFAKWAQVELI